MIKTVVTRGASFIGSHIYEKMLDKGYKAVCLDNFNLHYDPKIKSTQVLYDIRTENTHDFAKRI